MLLDARSDFFPSFLGAEKGFYLRLSAEIELQFLLKRHEDDRLVVHADDRFRFSPVRHVQPPNRSRAQVEK